MSAVGWLGNATGGGANVNMPPGGFKAASLFQNTLGVDVTVTMFNGEWGTGSGALHMKGFAYEDSAGVPGALVAVTDEIFAINGGTTPFPFSTPWVWPAGAFRWLGVISPEGFSSTHQNSTGGASIFFNTDPYTGSLPSNPFGAASSVTPFEYRFWVDCHDSQHRFGRISIRDWRASPAGVYWHYNPHYEKFVLDEAVSVRVTSMSTHVFTTDAGVTGHAAIYLNDGAGGPSASGPIGATLVAQTNDVVGATANTWVTFPFATGVVLAPGTYWLAVIFDTDLNCPVSVSGNLVAPILLGGDITMFPFQNPVPAASPSLFDESPLGISLYASYDLITVVDPATALVPQPLAFLPRRPTRVVAY